MYNPCHLKSNNIYKWQNTDRFHSPISQRSSPMRHSTTLHEVHEWRDQFQSLGIGSATSGIDFKFHWIVPSCMRNLWICSRPPISFQAALRILISVLRLDPMGLHRHWRDSKRGLEPVWCFSLPSFAPRRATTSAAWNCNQFGVSLHSHSHQQEQHVPVSWFMTGTKHMQHVNNKM